MARSSGMSSPAAPLAPQADVDLFPEARRCRTFAPLPVPSGVQMLPDGRVARTLTGDEDTEPLPGPAPLPRYVGSLPPAPLPSFGCTLHQPAPTRHWGT